MEETANTPKLAEFTLPPPMPTEIATAICEIKAAVSRLHRGERNAHGGFNYASVDQFYEAVGPIEGEVGLIVIPQHVGAPEPRTVKTKGGETTVVVYRFRFVIAHKSGVTWCDPTDISEQACPWMGAQTGGAAKSYAHKYYLRSLYSIPTGEKDADHAERWEMEDGQARVRASKAKSATGAKGGATVSLEIDGEFQAINVQDAPNVALKTLNDMPSGPSRRAWWDRNEIGLGQLHSANKPGWLTIKRAVENSAVNGQ